MPTIHGKEQPLGTGAAVQTPRPATTTMPTPQYRHPLVTDAVIDLRVTLAPESDLGTLGGLADSLSQDYPRRETTYTGTFHADFTLPAEGGPSVQATQHPDGLRLFNADGLDVVHLGLSGFTHSRLKPYTGWEKFSAEARRLWETYKRECQVQKVTRAAIRYIDRLDLPASEHVAEYLLLRPHLPKGFPVGRVEGFFQQLQMPLEDPEGKVVVNVARLMDPDPEIRSFVLDYDLFREGIWEPDDAALWVFLESLRHRKNELFEASITDRTRDLMGRIG